MDRRRQQRVFVDLPVQIWGMDAHSRPFSQPASVRSISGRGATLQGVDVQHREFSGRAVVAEHDLALPQPAHDADEVLDLRNICF